MKTVKESTYIQKIEFLHEANVMKDYNTENVIKLLGVFSEGQTALDGVDGEWLLEEISPISCLEFRRSLMGDGNSDRAAVSRIYQ